MKSQFCSKKVFDVFPISSAYPYQIFRLNQANTGSARHDLGVDFQSQIDKRHEHLVYWSESGPHCFSDKDLR